MRVPALALAEPRERENLKMLLWEVRGAWPSAGSPQKGTGTGILGRSQSPFASAGAQDIGTGVRGGNQFAFASAGDRDIGTGVRGGNQSLLLRRRWDIGTGVLGRSQPLLLPPALRILAPASWREPVRFCFRRRSGMSVGPGCLARFDLERFKTLSQPKKAQVVKRLGRTKGRGESIGNRGEASADGIVVCQLCILPQRSWERRRGRTGCRAWQRARLRRSNPRGRGRGNC